ncbi:hypothetical protein LXL04_039772 [Taraxacum kok-saghyz]
MLSPLPLPEIVITASPDGPFTAYDPNSGSVVGRFNGNRCPRNGICVLGKELFAASHVSPETRAGYVRIYYWWSMSRVKSIPLPEPVAPLAGSVDGLYVFSGGISGQIHSVSVHSGDVIRSFPVHEKPVSCVTINRDGSLILSGSDDGTIAVLPILLLLDISVDMESRYSSFTRFTGHESSVTGLTAGMGRRGGIMISSSLDCTCKMWSLNGIHLQTVRFPVEVWCTALNPPETELFAAGIDGMVYKRRLMVERRKQFLEGGKTVVWGGVHDGGVVAMEMLSDGRILLTVSGNGEIFAWDVESGKMIRGSGVGGGYGSRKEVGKAAKEVAAMKKVLKVAVEDRRRAISNLESAIEINENMLKLMLREAKAIAKSKNN